MVFVLATLGTRFGFLGTKTSVKEISTDQLRELQIARARIVEEAEQSGKNPPPATFLVVDVRSPQEHGVSLIPGAITKEQYENDVQTHSGKTVIPYCTVGARSERYAQQLSKQGVDALNYKESILGWCEKGLPLLTPEGEETNIVHTASSRIAAPPGYKAVW